ncbi:phospholipase D/nuclease, partial [Violaceomyces palustris]
MGLGDTLKKHTDPEVLANSLKRFGFSIQTALNPNHRHDEEHEKEQDRQRQAICDSHPFKSFAGPRPGNHSAWYSDGLDYFWALSEVLDSANDCIFILDWWLTPELYLRRPPALHHEFRLDRLLKRKAEQGVKVFIMVYKEVNQTMTMSSSHTKHFLEELHENITVMRHPDHLGGEVVLYWSHHDKVVVVDNTIACVGGLDICFGRWDTPAHPLADLHPTDLLNSTLFPGADFNNARIEDFQKVDQWVSNQQSNAEVGRMPWHDIHSIFLGPSVLDVSHNFVERWNFVKELKYKRDSHYPWLAFPHGGDPAEENAMNWDSMGKHPHTVQFHRLGQHFRHPFHPENREFRLDGQGVEVGQGSSTVQVLRSAGDWSSGILTERSIQNAYVQLIREASHYVYIENQFFVTATEPGGKVENLIGAALVERILSAAQSGKKFKVIVVIPTIPCFAGELDKAAGIRCIMSYQYKAMSRGGGKSIMECISEAGVDPNEYISFYNLRGYDRINTAPIKHMEEKSGVSYHQAQVALARIFLGDQGYASGSTKVAIKQWVNDSTLPPPGSKSKGGGSTVTKIAEVEMPKTEEEAREILKRFQQAAPTEEEGYRVRDSIATNVLHGQDKKTSEEAWWGEEDERLSYVTEEIYIHSKLMIVDDRKVLVGSANINDRSQLGDRDSETAVVIEDSEMVESKMNGQKYLASSFASGLRRRLWRQHLGLIDVEDCSPASERGYPTSAMRPPPHWKPDQERLKHHPEWEALVEDPLGEEVEKMWKDQARTNTSIYEEIFKVVPTDSVKNWNQYRDFFPQPPTLTGHVADPTIPLETIKASLSKVRGHLVECPLRF